MSSLLEVGTGFHPELTGRENIYLNGAILGMTQAEIRRKFDKIVDFANIERFLDTPVKRYSSGMYLRLAFSVAAHLDPEILIVDEVLAVGDAEFQKKCLGKMAEVSNSGRTVLFVSHNMSAVRSLTDRCLVLEGGRIKYDGATDGAVTLYLNEASRQFEFGIFQKDVVISDAKPFCVSKITVSDEEHGEPVQIFDCDAPVYITVEFAAGRALAGVYVYIILQRPDGTVVYEGDSSDSKTDRLDLIAAGHGSIVIQIPSRTLGVGRYNVFLNVNSVSDIAGPNLELLGVVGGFELIDTSTPRGNSRSGFLSTRLGWKLIKTLQPVNNAV